LARLEALLEELREGMREIRADIRELRTEVQHLREETRAEVRRLDNKIDRNFLWTLGVMITMWVTLIVAILLRT
jgi:hypothetical protein